jgi:hypothetical protein
MTFDTKHSNDLCLILADTSKWPALTLSEDFLSLSRRVEIEVSKESVSSQIAAVFVMHQIMHEMTKHLISLSTLYIQGEIWPTEYKPAYDKNKDQMTGWYLAYLKDNCINFDDKDKFTDLALSLNKLRNELAHHMTGKNEVVVSHTFDKYILSHKLLLKTYRSCEKRILDYLFDLTNRVDFS